MSLCCKANISFVTLMGNAFTLLSFHPPKLKGNRRCSEPRAGDAGPEAGDHDGDAQRWFMAKYLDFPNVLSNIFEKHCFLGMPTDILVLAEGDFSAGESLKKKWLFFFAQIFGQSSSAKIV